MKTQKRRFIVVGNADLPRDLSREIDSADYVLRFNQPRLLDGWSGSKTSCLMMCNSGKPMQEKLGDPTFFECKFFKKAELITFVYHPYIIKTYFARPRLLSQLFKHRRVDFLHHYDLTEWEIYICGFTWKGWKHHAWSAEEKWVRDRINEGTCRFLE